MKLLGASKRWLSDLGNQPQKTRHQRPRPPCGWPSYWAPVSHADPNLRSYLKSLFVTGYLSTANGFTITSLTGPSSFLFSRELDPIWNFPPGSCTMFSSFPKAKREEIQYENFSFLNTTAQDSMHYLPESHFVYQRGVQYGKRLRVALV